MALGISVLFALVLYKLLGERFQITFGIVSLLLAYLLVLDIREIKAADNDRTSLEKTMALLRSANNEDLPTVIGDPHTFVLFAHYAPLDVRSHLVYLADPALAGQVLRFTSVEKAMVQLVGPWFHMKVVPFEEFVASNSRFLLYGATSRGWLNRALRHRSFRIEFMREQGASESLFMATSCVDRICQQ